VLLGSHVCIQNDSLQLIDISDPAQPKAVGSYLLPGGPDGFDAFAFQDSTLFVSNDSRWEVIDWSNPAQPVKLAEVETGHEIGFLAVQDQYLYTIESGATAFGSHFSVWDVSQPTHPVRAGDFTSPASLFLASLGPVRLSGRYAFVGEGGAYSVWVDVVMLDISNPARPLPVGRSPMGSRDLGRSLAQNGFLFSAGGEHGLTVRSLAGPLNMLLPPERQRVLFGETAELTVGVYSMSPVQYQWYFGPSGDTSNPVPGATGNVLSLPPVWELSSYWVRVTNQSGQIDSQAVATRPVPALDFKLLAPGPHLNGAAQGIALGEHLAYFVAADTFHVIDVSNPAQPTERSQLPLSVAGSAGLVVSEPYACVWAQGEIFQRLFQRIDVSDPSHPRLTGRYSTGGDNIVQIAISSSSPTNSRAYLAVYGDVGTGGVIAVDLSDPTELKPISTYRFATSVDDVCATSHYALAVTGGALQVIDFADPAHPQVVGSYSAENLQPKLIYRVLISGRYALINLSSFDGPSFIPGLEILDISDPVHPQLVGSARIVGSLMAVDGTRAFLGYNGIQVVDFTDPAMPALVGAFNTVNSEFAAAARGNNLFVIDDNRFLSMELSPRLRLDVPLLGPGTFTLRWTGAPGVVLQQTHSLASPAWLDLDGTDGRSRIDLPRSVQPAFFRAVRR
jgi:hypothetical protein